MTKETEADREKAENLVTHFNDRRLIPKRGYSLRAEDKAYLTQFILEALAQAREEGRQEMKEMASKAVEDHLIYTRPGGIDQEPIQKILAKAIRKL